MTRSASPRRSPSSRHRGWLLPRCATASATSRRVRSASHGHRRARGEGQTAGGARCRWLPATHWHGLVILPPRCALASAQPHGCLASSSPTRPCWRAPRRRGTTREGAAPRPAGTGPQAAPGQIAVPDHAGGRLLLAPRRSVVRSITGPPRRSAPRRAARAAGTLPVLARHARQMDRHLPWRIPSTYDRLRRQGNALRRPGPNGRCA
jgi:hypothetical protein